MAKVISNLPSSSNNLSRTSQLINDGESNVSVYVEKTSLDLKENAINKQNSLVIDGTGTKFPTVDAVNALNVNNLNTSISSQTKLGSLIIARNTTFGGIELDANQLIHRHEASGSVSFRLQDLAASQGAFALGTNTVNISMRENSPRYISVTDPIESPAPIASNHLTTKSYVDAQIIGGSTPNASPTVSGKAKLYNSLGNSTDGSVDQNTVNTALNLKEPAFAKNTAFNKNYSIVATDIKINGVQGLGILDTLSRADHIHPVDTSREAIIAVGTIAQYWRGDKTWQTLDKTAVGLSLVDNTSDANKPISTATQAALNNKLETSLKGAVNGLAELDAQGFVKNTQLPSYVDDVLEFANLASFPATGEAGKIYVAIDTNKTYRWGGTVYVVIGSDLALGETSATAYRGDRGKIAFDHTLLTNNPHSTTKLQVGLGNVDDTSNATERSAIATLINKTINLTSNTLVATSAQILASITDETGTGLLVFNSSPALTGIPIAPTATLGTNTTQIATTSFVQSTTNANALLLTGNQSVSGIKEFRSATPSGVIELGGTFGLANAQVTTSRSGYYADVYSTGHGINIFNVGTGGYSIFARDGVGGGNEFFVDRFAKVQGSSFTSTGAGNSSFVGNVGIGTTAPTANLTVAQSTVSIGTVVTNATITLTGTGTTFTNTFKVGDAITVSGETVRTIASITNDTSLTVSVAFATTTSALSYTLVGGNRLVVRGNGDVGIGTATPTERLDVVGNGKFSGSVTATSFTGTTANFSGNVGIGTAPAARRLTVASADSEQLVLTSTAASNLAGLFLNPANTTFSPFIGATGNNIVLHTDGAERIRVSSSGNTLQVNGTVSATKYNITTGANASAGNATLVAGTVTVTTTAATASSLIQLTRKTAGGTLGFETYTTTAGSFTINSDILDTSTFTYSIAN